MTVLGGLQRDRAIQDVLHDIERFNTDDGIRRATTSRSPRRIRSLDFVSIPMTVLGGLQRKHHENYLQTYQVSIPMTVLGGLQHEYRDFVELNDEGFQYR